MIKSFENMNPVIDSTAKIAENATIVGNVVLKESANIWYNAVLRADVNEITVGAYTNIQDGTVVHNGNNSPVTIGEYVSIGHQCVIHGCTIKDNVLVGMGSIIMDNCVVEKNCVIGAGSLLTQNKHFEEGSLIMGSPAKVVRKLTEEDFEAIKQNAKHYLLLSKQL